MQAAYGEVVKSHGGTLSVTGNWKSEELYAGATQMMGNWRVQISGALARRPELTADGFTLILCHELGHHLGGFSFAPSGNPFEKVWAANEGQADYFSTQVCARKLWAKDLERNASFRGTAPAYVRERCEAAWENEADRDLCYRTAEAGASVTRTMASLLKKPEPQFDTPDPTVVPKTNDGHPAVQCRHDTIFLGAICPVAFDERLIPGKKSEGGPFGLEAERESAQRSCTRLSNQAFGHRPRCWFKARM